MKMYETPKGTSYRFERHALNRMAQRRIRRRDVENILDNYDTCHPDRQGNPCFVGYLQDGRRLRIVAAEEGNLLIVITAVILD